MGKENKLHIILLGRRNTGKSSLMNALTGQAVSIISDVAGTTTDLVKRSYEIPGFASVVFMDTAGLDDTGELGEMRVKRSLQAISQADIALLVITHNQFDASEEKIIQLLQKQEIPFLIIHNKKDEEGLDDYLYSALRNRFSVPVIDLSVHDDNTPSLILELLEKIGRDHLSSPQSLTEGLVTAGDVVLLVTPIDSEAPAGRMILPQVQTLRDLLDHHGTAIVLQPEEIESFLEKTGIVPRLAITDSQVFHRVASLLPGNIPLTSFSILLARHKGAFDAYLKGTPHIDRLKEGDRVLLLESCSHHVSCEDIGRHKIPAWLQKHTGRALQFDFVTGLDAIPRPITDYAMVIQCGGCMITRKQLKSRLQPAIDAGIPVSNYGMTIAYLHGIFGRAVAPFGVRR